MLLSYGRVTNISWSISTSGSGVSFLTPASLLQDGRPGTVTRFLWPSAVGGGVTIVTLEGVWPTAEAVSVGFFGLIHTTLPVGSIITVLFRIAGTSTFDGATFRQVVELPGGARVMYDEISHMGAVYDGVRVQIESPPIPPAIAPGTVIDIGEIWLGQSTELKVLPDWGVDVEDATVTRESEYDQPYSARGIPRRVLTFTPARREEQKIYSGDLDFETLQMHLTQGNQVVCVPRRDDDDSLHRQAIFGTVTKLPGYKHLRGKWFGHGPVTVKEAPAPVAL